MAQAQYKIHITNNPNSADLLVYLVSNQGLAIGNGVWYITPHYGEASHRIYFCSRAMAQFSVCFVKQKTQAGWQKSSPWSGIF